MDTNINIEKLKYLNVTICGKKYCKQKTTWKNFVSLLWDNC